MNKWLESSRQFFYMSMAIFFLSSGGFMIRLMFIEDPFHYLGRRFLEQDGKMVIDILSNPRTIQAIRAITTPSPKDQLPLERYIVDRILQQDGAWLRGFTQKLLQDPHIQKLASQAFQSSPSSTPPQQQTSYLLGRYAIDKLLQHDASTLQKLLLPSTQQLTASVERTAQNTLHKITASVELTAQNAIHKITASAERTAQNAIHKLFEKDAAVLRALLKDALQPPAASAPKTTAKLTPTVLSALDKEQIAMAERLGRYTIDQLLDARAQKLRAILLSLVGPELMRTLREGRLSLNKLTQQAQSLPVRQIIQDAAFSAGKGATEGFLGAQSQQKQRTARITRAIARQAPHLRDALRRLHPCLLASDPQWLRWQDNALHARLIRAKDAVCQKTSCAQFTQTTHAWLQNQLSPLNLHPNDIHVQIGGCD